MVVALLGVVVVGLGLLGVISAVSIVCVSIMVDSTVLPESQLALSLGGGIGILLFVVASVVEPGREERPTAGRVGAWWVSPRAQTRRVALGDALWDQPYTGSHEFGRCNGLFWDFVSADWWVAHSFGNLCIRTASHRYSCSHTGPTGTRVLPGLLLQRCHICHAQLRRHTTDFGGCAGDCRY
jgi:hypothetical protein